jgi:hypothetical protein
MMSRRSRLTSAESSTIKTFIFEGTVSTSSRSPAAIRPSVHPEAY